MNRLTEMFPTDGPTEAEKRGVEAILYLQSLDPDIEHQTEEQALHAWRFIFDQSMRDRTMQTFLAMKPSPNN
jgi:hypothetical protein